MIQSKYWFSIILMLSLSRKYLHINVKSSLHWVNHFHSMKTVHLIPNNLIDISTIRFFICSFQFILDINLDCLYMYLFHLRLMFTCQHKFVIWDVCRHLNFGRLKHYGTLYTVIEYCCSIQLFILIHRHIVRENATNTGDWTHFNQYQLLYKAFVISIESDREFFLCLSGWQQNKIKDKIQLLLSLFSLLLKCHFILE